MATRQLAYALLASVIASLAPACGTGNSSGFSGKDAGHDGTGGSSSGDSGIVLGNDSSGASETGSDSPSSGPPVCDSSCTAAGGTCSMGVCTLAENPGGVSSSTQSALKGGGTADSLYKWLYPYDATVFPRGLLSPTLQLDGATGADAVWIHIEFPAMTYDGFFAGSSPVQVKLPDASWKAVTYAARPTDVVKVSATKISGGMVTGPATESWTIAPGNIRGTIYYETYDSAIIGGIGSVGIMQISPGASAPTPVKKGCANVCHTASADGSTLVAMTSFLGLTSSSYDLKSGASLLKGATDERFAYGGLYPDGTFAMSATNFRLWIAAPSRLYDTKTGANIAAPGWDGVIKNAGTSSFSPNGKMIAFNHEDTGGGHSLALMNFDVATHTFSGLTDVATDPANTLAWPAFTPDVTSLVYHAGSSNEFETDGGNTGDIYVVDIATKTVHRADALDGYTGSGTATYLPANDPNLSFAPTILPEAVGGYFWVVFTSHRSYGNTLPSQDNGDEYGKLWVSAMDIGAKPGTDPTHPAFFLDGQELHADNLRGFWVLPPCKNDGSSCTSGDECCGGFCRGDMCVPPPMGCANEYEKCTVSSDCCKMTDQCINGYCAQPSPK